MDCAVDVALPVCVLVCCNSASVQSFSADDSSRVLLLVPNTSGTDYINASFVDVSAAYKCSICKGLQPNGVVDKLKSEAAHYTSRRESQLLMLTFGTPLVFKQSSFL